MKDFIFPVHKNESGPTPTLCFPGGTAPKEWEDGGKLAKFAEDMKKHVKGMDFSQ